MKSVLRVFIVVIIASVIHLSITWAAALETPAGNVLRLGIHVSKIGKMDPHFAAASQDRLMADMLFNGLLRYVPGNAPKIEPDLASTMPTFEMIDGKQVWTFKLRKGVMFHPGPETESYELTADDVIYSLNKSADSQFCAYSSEYADMVFKATDPYTINIILSKSLSPILFFPKFTNYAGGFIVSKKAIETMGYEAFSNHPIGTGPFLFEKHLPENKIILGAHKAYFRGTPLLNGVEIYFLQDIEEREALFLSGKLDVIYGSGTKGWIEKIESRKNNIVDAHGVGEVATVYFNTTIKPLDDINVRKAIAYTLDRELFINATSKRFTGKVYSPVPAMFLPGGLTEEKAGQLRLEYSRDLKKARQMLKDAGYPDGFTLELVTSEKRIYQSYYEILKEQLSQVNITCNITVLTHSDMHKEIRNNPKPIVIYAAWRPNADVYLTRFFHSDSIIINGSTPDTNFACYDKIDQLIEAARLEINPEKQVNLWEQAQIRILSDMVAFPIMYTIQLYVRKNYVDYGHHLTSTMALYPQFTEKTHFKKMP